MRAGIAAGTASSDPFAALVAGGAAPTGRGMPAETRSFGAALELAERMLDAPTGADGSVRLAPTVTTELTEAPSDGEHATDATESAPRETSVSAVPVDAVSMISAMAAAPAPTPAPTTVLADAPTVTTFAADDGSTPGTTETASASRSDATADDGIDSTLFAPPTSATGGEDADAPLDRAAAPARASAAPDPTVSVPSTGPSSAAGPVHGAPPVMTAPTTLTPAPAATRVEASAPPAAAPSAPSSTGASGVTAAAAPAPSTVADPSDRPAGPAAATPSAPVVAPAASASAPAVAVVSPPEPPASARSVATQVSPVVVNIAQRPAGSHQLTMTVSPDTLGPVTVRAHIGQNGDVRVELVGATDAGREALRAIVSDLRRDLAAVLPHANLSLTSSSASSTDAGGSDRFAQPGTDPGAGGQAGDRRDSGPVVAPGLRVDAPDRRSVPTSALAVAGAGLDTFA
ncbi:hypothetical protein [Microbacterium sp. NPDC087868]|uniref:flagellar hook-length control protein FliK n=1 Tax=Microbacterium sp. NPDC087868 TaxID=3364195 RepID=UPI00384E3930